MSQRSSRSDDSHLRSQDPTRLTPQLSLDLKERMPHGGVRPGAGRPRKKDSERGFIAHRARPSLRKDHPVHVTLRATRNVPSLRSDLLERIVKRALVAQRDAMAKKGAKSFQLVDFTVQEDHLHLIVEATDKHASHLATARRLATTRPPRPRRCARVCVRSDRFSDLRPVADNQPREASGPE